MDKALDLARGAGFIVILKKVATSEILLGGL